MFESQLSRSVTLVVPGKNLEMTFRLKCEEMCDERKRSRWLIDIGIGHKSLLRGKGDPTAKPTPYFSLLEGAPPLSLP